MYDGIDTKNWHTFGLPVHEIKNINDHIQEIENLNVDFIIMCGWRQLLKKEFVTNPQFKIIGFHPTLLPKGRGPAPIINTILEGFSYSGVTLYYVDEGLDNGDIIGQEPFDIFRKDHASDVYEKMTIAGKKLIKKYLPLLEKGNAPRIPQNETAATIFPKRTLSENEIFMDTDSAETIYRKIRAFSKPYNGAFFFKDNKKIILWHAEIEE